MLGKSVDEIVSVRIHVPTAVEYNESPVGKLYQVGKAEVVKVNLRKDWLKASRSKRIGACLLGKVGKISRIPLGNETKHACALVIGEESKLVTSRKNSHLGKS